MESSRTCPWRPRGSLRTLSSFNSPWLWQSSSLLHHCQQRWRCFTSQLVNFFINVAEIYVSPTTSFGFNDVGLCPSPWPHVLKPQDWFCILGQVGLDGQVLGLGLDTCIIDSKTEYNLSWLALVDLWILLADQVYLLQEIMFTSTLTPSVNTTWQMYHITVIVFLLVWRSD